MGILNKIPQFSSGDYKNMNAYYDEGTTKGKVQYILHPKVYVTPEEGVYRTILGELSLDEPYADYTSVFVKTFINMPFKKDAAYDKNTVEIKTKQGIVKNETPTGETNPNYMGQPTFLVAFPGRDTLVLDPSTRMLTNTRSAQGTGTNNNRRNNNTSRRGMSINNGGGSTY
jgi:hypothetical protein